MKRFYVVMVNATPGLAVSDVQEALGTDHDWYRIANNVWVVRTHLSVDSLHNRLEYCVRPSGTMFISQLNPRQHQGLMPQEFWDWLNNLLRAYPQ